MKRIVRDPHQKWLRKLTFNRENHSYNTTRMSCLYFKSLNYMIYLITEMPSKFFPRQEKESYAEVCGGVNDVD